MPIPRTESAKSALVKRAIKRRPQKFKRGSHTAAAREVLAKKIMKHGKNQQSAYAISTAVLKGTVRRRHA